MRQRALATAAALVALGLIATGCSILREPPAEQLYRLNGPVVAAPPAARPDVAAVRIGLDPGAFPREAAGLRILTTEDARVSYLAGARWAAPAALMFETALLRSFAERPDAALYGRGAGGAAQTLLRVDVTQFEAAYDQGAALPPLVRVRATARVVMRTDRQVLGERTFYAESRASENRVAAVVQSYDAATSEMLGQLAGWSVDTARRAAPAG